MARQDIIQELNELGSRLAAAPHGNFYSVPEGYFDSFSAAVLKKITLENTDKELDFVLPTDNPYTIPSGYFESFADRMLQKIRDHADYLNSREELESISPLLSSLNKEPVYSVPQGYFGNFSLTVSPAQPAKVVPMFGRKIFQYAAAAVITVIIAGAGWLIYHGGQKPPAEKVMAKMEKDVKKMDNVQQLDNLSDLMDADLNEKSVARIDKIKTDDVEKLLQDVSVEELKDFSEESKAIEDVMVTN